MSIGNVLYKLDPTLAPVRPRWSLPRAFSHRSTDRAKNRGR
jgi:hypothetical protein